MSLRLVDVHKTFQQGSKAIEVLRGVSFSCAPGESVAIVGRSGSGKSTLLAMIAGLDRPSAGSVELDGKELSRASEQELAKLRGREIGIIFQQFHLVSDLTALENVALPLELAGAVDAEPRAAAALESVGLAARADHFPRQLSGGEAQRVAIARALVVKPKLLLADEPTGNLDFETAGGVAELIFRLAKEQNTALVLVTHSEELAARCQRELHLKNGLFA